MNRLNWVGDCVGTVTAALALPVGARRLCPRFAMIGSTIGVAFGGAETGGRSDWVIIDVAKAAVAYCEGLIPEDEKKREMSARQEAAKLTLERRQMREEMARLRLELKELKTGGGASAQSVEERLATLQELRTKALISDEEYQRRRAEILGDI